MKYYLTNPSEYETASPSPRRAWIEMISFKVNNFTVNVALPTEGVD